MTRALPSAAQNWGRGVDTKIASLNAEIATTASQAKYISNAVESVVRSVATSGVAQFSTNKVRENNFRYVSNEGALLSVPLEWGDRGLNALVTVRATVRAAQTWPSGFNNALDTGTYLVLGVESGDKEYQQEYEIIVPVVSIGGRPQYFGSATETFSVDYNRYKDGSIYVRLITPKGWGALINSSTPGSFIELSTNTTLM